MSFHSLIPQTGGGADATKLPLAGGTLTGLLNFSGTTHAGIRLNSLTTTQRDALTAGAGDFLFNTTLNQFQGYVSGAWASMATLGANTFASTQTIAIPSGTDEYVDVKYNGSSRFRLHRLFDTVTELYLDTCVFAGNYTGQGRLLLASTGGGDGMSLSPKEWITVGSGTKIGFTSSNPTAVPTPTAFFMYGGAAACVQMGEDAAGVTNQHFKACNRITSDGVGANLTLSGGNGRGDYGGNLLLSYYAPGGSGLAGTLTTALTLSAEGFFAYAEGINLAFGSSTGTKIGTVDSQKLAFWNKTPIVQPTTAITAASFANNSSGIVDDSATYGGYTMGQIAAALINVGILA